MKVTIGLVLLCLAAVCQRGADSLAVMSVDLGSEWMKVAIVSPGVPMEIALNKESKRKTPVVVSFRDGERTFGEDAQTVGVRFPQNSYAYLLDLVGKTVDNPAVKLFQKRFPYYNIVPEPERGTVVFQHDSETSYTIEELIAMLFHKARHFAQTSASQAINEAVLTVPGYFNQAERRAILQAAQLADIKVLQLINDYTAVDDVKKKWHGLRDTFRKEYNKANEHKSGDGGENASDSSWPYYGQLLFLKDVVSHRKQHANTSPKKNKPTGHYPLIQSPSGAVSNDEHSLHMESDLPETASDASNSNDTVFSNPSSEALPSMQPPPNTAPVGGRFRKRKPENTHIDPFIEIEKQKLKLLSENSIAKQNPDYLFLQSLLPFLMNVPKNRKLAVRNKLQQVLIDEENRNTAFSASHRTTEFSASSSHGTDSGAV